MDKLWHIWFSFWQFFSTDSDRLNGIFFSKTLTFTSTLLLLLAHYEFHKRPYPDLHEN